MRGGEGRKGVEMRGEEREGEGRGTGWDRMVGEGEVGGTVDRGKIKRRRKEQKKGKRTEEGGISTYLYCMYIVCDYIDIRAQYCLMLLF